MNAVYLLLIILIIGAIVGIYLVKKAKVSKVEISNETVEELATVAAEEILENITAENMTPEEFSDYLG